MILLIKLIFLHFFLIRKTLKDRALNKTLEAYYIIKIAGVACFVLSLVWKSIDYVNCSILEKFLNFSNLPFHYYIRRGCRFNNPFSSPISKRLVTKRDKPFRYSGWLVVIDLVGILVRKILTIKNLSETLELKTCMIRTLSADNVYQIGKNVY